MLRSPTFRDLEKVRVSLEVHKPLRTRSDLELRVILHEALQDLVENALRAAYRGQSALRIHEEMNPKYIQGLDGMEEIAGSITRLSEDHRKAMAAWELLAEREKSPRKHYEIIGYQNGEVIGCTRGDEGKDEVLAEEPTATFREVKPSECRSCKSR
jgi:hypothetical protein